MDKVLLMIAGTITLGASSIYAEQALFPEAAIQQTLVDGTTIDVLSKLNNRGVDKFLQLSGKPALDSEHFSERFSFISDRKLQTDITIFDDHVLNITATAIPSRSNQTQLSIKATLPPSALTNSDMLSEQDLERLEIIATSVAKEYALSILEKRKIDQTAYNRMIKQLGMSKHEFSDLIDRLGVAIKHAYADKVLLSRRGIAEENHHHESGPLAIDAEQAAQRAIDSANEEEDADWHDGGWSDEAVK